MKSGSYKSAYEILKSRQIEKKPYEYLEKIGKTKNIEEQREWLLKILMFLKEYKEVYCFKDIIYNKINLFWENKAFLYKQSNKKEMKEEYKKTFVEPAIKYIESIPKGDYNCIDCGSKVGKSQAEGMSWIKDLGVDMNRKNSAFWNFHEDAFLCPVCALIYSCIPMGFVTIKSNGIFVNDNEDINMLMLQNNEIRKKIDVDETINQIQQNVFYNLLMYSKQDFNEVVAKNEQKNLQVIKRIKMDKDNMKYQFNIITKEKLTTFEKVKDNFKNLLKIRINIESKNTWMNVYDEVLYNFLENKKQYSLMNELINDSIINEKNINYIKDILKIQLYSSNIGGEKVEDLQKEINKMQYAGRSLRPSLEENKLRSYVFQLNNALRVNNVNLFMEIIARTYCGLAKDIPNSYGFAKMLADNQVFKLLGYAYILGLKQERIEENKGGKENE